MAHNKRTTINIPSDLVEHIGTLKRRMPQQSTNDLLIALARQGAFESQSIEFSEKLQQLDRLANRLASASSPSGEGSAGSQQEMRRNNELISQLIILMRFFLAEIHQEAGHKVIEKAKKEHNLLLARARQTRPSNPSDRSHSVETNS